jgi:hypothetical protein
MTFDTKIADAIAIGKRQANDVIDIRENILLNRPVQKTQNDNFELIPRKYNLDIANRFGAPSSDVLIAEGDSWFDYPGQDILNILDDTYGFDIESSAHKGDSIENMAYEHGQFFDFSRKLEKTLRNYATPPRAVLLSGGGNDLAGDEFRMLLNYRGSPSSGLSEGMIQSVIHERIKLSYITLIQRMTDLCIKLTGKPIPIIVHGYDYPIPDGRGFMGGWGPLPGPWFSPSFRSKGFDDLHECMKITNTLIDSFNAMLSTLSSIDGFQHIHYVDLRNTLSATVENEKYKEDWANELHPKEDGFSKITQKIHSAILKIM